MEKVDQQLWIYFVYKDYLKIYPHIIFSYFSIPYDILDYFFKKKLLLERRKHKTNDIFSELKPKI